MARSAISAVTQTAIGSHPQITRFLKGVFELWTPLPKHTHTHTWDVELFLDYFRNQKCNVELSLKELTKKTCCIVAPCFCTKGTKYSSFEIELYSVSYNRLYHSLCWKTQTYSSRLLSKTIRVTLLPGL